MLRPAVPVLILLPDNGLGEAAEDGPSAYGPTTHVGDLEDAPGS